MDGRWLTAAFLALVLSPFSGRAADAPPGLNIYFVDTEGGAATLVVTPVELVLHALEGHRRHRLLDEQGQELRRFQDELPAAAQEVLGLLGVDTAPYGLS